MKKIIFSIFCIAVLLTGCTSSEIVYADLNIVGDVWEETKLNELWIEVNKVELEYGSEKINCVDTAELLGKLDLVYQDNNVYLKAVDGFTIMLTDETLKDTYLGYSNADKWVFVSDKHPVNSRIKNICEMIIVKATDEVNYDFGLNVIVEDQNINYSIGELLINPHQVMIMSDGVSSKAVDGEHYTVDVMQQKKVLPLSRVIDERFAFALIMSKSGEQIHSTNGDGLIEIHGSTLNYIRGNKICRDIAGVIINPPRQTVMDTYYDALYYLEQDQDVMILFIDGFSYKQYLYFLNNNQGLFVSNVDNVVKAHTIYKPVTNAGFAAMISGEPPATNGVLNRDYRELKVDTIFDRATELGKKSLLVEGNVNILKLSITPVLNIDENNNGMTDDEIFETAMAEVNKNYNLFMVHFHSLDDVGHDFGDINEQIINQMILLDDYITQLVSKWQGKVIIVSDHGMHSTATGGSHGQFRAEDMFIPYLILDGGSTNAKE